MMTVAQVSKRTGVSVRTLHHYDQIGLLDPTEVTDAGYRLYDDTALDKLYMILVYRELGLSLNEIGSILDAPDYDRNRVLEHQIKLMQERVEKLQNRISFARGMLMLGVKYMDFEGFDPKKIDEYSQQAKVLYGKTEGAEECATLVIYDSTVFTVKSYRKLVFLFLCYLKNVSSVLKAELKHLGNYRNTVAKLGEISDKFDLHNKPPSLAIKSKLNCYVLILFYFARHVMRPLLRSYTDTSMVTRSPGNILI